MSECLASANYVAEHLTDIGDQHEGIADVRLCDNGCFNLEGWIIQSGEPGGHTDSDTRKWFKVGMGVSYSADDILAAFPDARNDCPGVAQDD